MAASNTSSADAEVELGDSVIGRRAYGRDRHAVRAQLAGLAKRQAELGLDAKQLARARAVASKALAGKRQLTRQQLLAAFDQAKLDANPHRGYHLLFYLAATRSHGAQLVLPIGKGSATITLDATTGIAKRGR